MANGTRTRRQEAGRGETHLSPHHNDGGWHGSAIGSEKLDTLWQPLADRLLVKKIAASRQVGTLFMPDIAADDRNTNRGIILRCGPGKRIAGEGNTRQPLSVKVGDEIIFGPYTDWDNFGDNIVLIQEADIRVLLSPRSVKLAASQEKVN